MLEIHFTNFYLHVLTTKDNVGNSSSRTYTIYIAKLKIGDYVKYEPDNNNSTYNLKAIYSGYDTDKIIDASYDPTEWRIMEIDENGNITKLFGVPNSNQSEVGFGNSIGYNNGVYLLNDICKSRYGNASLGATARNLNIEDIESRMNATGIAAKNAYKFFSVQYGKTRKYTGNCTKYPALYEQEKYSGVHRDVQGNLVEVSDVEDGTQVITESADATAQAKMNPNGKTRSEALYTTPTTETYRTDAINLTCTQTHYYFDSTPSSYFDDTNFHSMIFGTGTNFWLASRFVGCSSYISYALFGLRYVYGNYLNCYHLFCSNGDSSSSNYRLASVVSLGSGIQIKSGSGTESDPYVIGK